MCNKVVNRCFFVLDSIPDWYNTQEMCGKVISEDIFLIVYCPDDSLAQLILIPDCFVTSRMIKKKTFYCFACR